MCKPVFFRSEIFWKRNAFGPLVWFGNTTLCVFGWIGCWSFNFLSGFMEGYVILKFCFEDFFLGFPIRANSVVCRKITIAICTFLFHLNILDPHDLAVRICIFLFVFAESVVMTILLAIEAPLWIWYIHFFAVCHQDYFHEASE